jgi:hypothetical protein
MKGNLDQTFLSKNMAQTQVLKSNVTLCNMNQKHFISIKNYRPKHAVTGENNEKIIYVI